MRKEPWNAPSEHRGPSPPGPLCPPFLKGWYHHGLCLGLDGERGIGWRVLWEEFGPSP